MEDPDPALDLRDSPCATSNGLVAAFALPDTDGVPLDAVLAAECACVLGVLGDFHLLHLLSEGCTVSIQSRLSIHLQSPKDGRESRISDRVKRSVAMEDHTLCHIYR